MKITPVDAGNVQLVQITDTHVYADSGGTFEGVDTAAALDRVIERINAAKPVPDAILLTGDLVHHPGRAVYQKLLRQLSMLNAPVFCLPGNHDDPELMQAIFNDNNVSMKKILEISNWTLVLLNTWLPDSHSGRLSREELEFLEESIAANEKKYILVCLHHPPVKTGSPWMDAMMLENPDDLFNITDAYSRVRGILWGHIHQEFYQERKGLKLLGSPSTCVQFKPDTQQFTKDVLPPAYRLLTLSSGGDIASRIVWL